MRTALDTTAFWQMMADRYEKLLAEATTEKDRAIWQKHLNEALAKANPNPPNHVSERN